MNLRVRSPSPQHIDTHMEHPIKDEWIVEPTTTSVPTVSPIVATAITAVATAATTHLPEPRILFQPSSQGKEMAYQQTLGHMRTKLMAMIERIGKEVQEKKKAGLPIVSPAYFRIHEKHQDIRPCAICQLGEMVNDQERCFHDVYRMLAGAGHPVALTVYESGGKRYRCIRMCLVAIPDAMRKPAAC